jgi:hypothetical protein
MLDGCRVVGYIIGLGGFGSIGAGEKTQKFANSVSRSGARRVTTVSTDSNFEWVEGKSGKSMPVGWSGLDISARLW